MLLWIFCELTGKIKTLWPDDPSGKMSSDHSSWRSSTWEQKTIKLQLRERKSLVQHAKITLFSSLPAVLKLTLLTCNTTSSQLFVKERQQNVSIVALACQRSCEHCTAYCHFALLRKCGLKWEDCWSVKQHLFWVNSRRSFTAAFLKQYLTTKIKKTYMIHTQ